MTFSRDPTYQAESIAIPLSHLVEHKTLQYLEPEVANWLLAHGVTDDIKDCEWWLDLVNKPYCIRVWLRDESLRMLFKLTWGGR